MSDELGDIIGQGFVTERCPDVKPTKEHDIAGWHVPSCPECSGKIACDTCPKFTSGGAKT
jgi:hypothetical protein